MVFNTFSKGCVLLDDETYAAFERGEIYSEQDETARALNENGLLVEDDFDELAYLRYHNHRIRYAKDYMSLTIAPTLACNFDCPYCFEHKRLGFMSNEVERKALEFVERKLEAGVRRLDVTWYGGEPLLRFDQVRSMCAKIVGLCDKNGVKLKMGMISNGYLLDEEIVEFLDQYKISFQVTLDGMCESHNERRYLKGGEGTFDVIAQNLKLFNSKDVIVYVRMNIDNVNAPDYGRLKEFIADYGNANLVVYPALTENVNERLDWRSQLYSSLDEYNDFVASTRREGFFCDSDAGMPISNDVSSLPDNRSYYCAAELDNSYVIDELGNVFKCWNEVGGTHPCFSVFDEDSVNYKNLLCYMGDLPFDDPVCVECSLLPLCFGGCKFHLANFGKRFCSHTKASLKAYIEDRILQK